MSLDTFYSVISVEMGPTLNVRHEKQIVLVPF